MVFIAFDMPSDSKKREQQRKKDAQKKRNQKITVITKDSQDEEAQTNGTTNGFTNGTNGTTNGAPVELTEDGNDFILMFFINLWAISQ